MAEDKKKSQVEDNKEIENLKYEVAQEIGLDIREEEEALDQTK